MYFNAVRFCTGSNQGKRAAFLVRTDFILSRFAAELLDIVPASVTNCRASPHSADQKHPEALLHADQQPRLITVCEEPRWLAGIDENGFLSQAN